MPDEAPEAKRGPLRRPLGRCLARLLDLTLAALLLALTWPLILFLALAIRWGNPGPLLFAQMREGLHGRPFRLWKIRTMHPDAAQRLAKYLAENSEARNEWETTYCLQRDPRVLGALAQYTRQYSLDELPQLWNVLIGQMALVGPRPLEPTLAAQLFDSATRVRRLCVRPGLTGLWQVSRRDKREVTTTMGEHDLRYIARRTIWLDLRILFKTPSAVLTGGG